MKIRRVLVVGGTGFIGTAVVRRLVAEGVCVTVPTRRLAHAQHLLVLPTVEIVRADVHEDGAAARLVRGHDAVVNLVGILHSRPGSPWGLDFARAHVELPRAIARACDGAGVARLLHVSALKASRDAPSAYLRSKAAGEEAIGEGRIAPTILRPSVVFGPGDSFLNLFAGLARRLPLLPLACPQARFQPVWVGDVAAVIAEALARPESAGQTYELCGPAAYSLRELVRMAAALSGHPRPVIGLPDALSRVQAALLERLPGQLMTRDNLASMRVDSVCAGCALPFGRTPASIEAIAATWLAPAHR